MHELIQIVYFYPDTLTEILVLKFNFFILDVCVLPMTHGRYSQVEQQQLISVEKAIEILNEPASPLIVDYKDLQVCTLSIF